MHGPDTCTPCTAPARLKPGSESESLYNGMPESIEYVLDYIKANGPFDGLMGFSQVPLAATQVLPERLHAVTPRLAC